MKVDVRVIAATHRDLEAAVDAGEFREDLYYRLNVMPIVLPALRDRMEDIADLAHFLAGRIGELQGRRLSLTEGAIRRLSQYSWPGNVRELENCLERASVMSESGTIEADLILIDRYRETGASSTHSPHSPHSPSTLPASSFDTGLNRSASPLSYPTGAVTDNDLDERSRVISALEQAGWVQARAARILGMTPRQIAYRILTLNIEVKKI